MNVFTPCERFGELAIIWTDYEEVSEERKAVIRNLVANMVKVEGGTFMMGAQSIDPQGQQYDAAAKADESPVHQVTLDDFYIGKYEITQQEWLAVMGSETDWPTIYGHGDRIPSYNISYNEAKEFVRRLSNLTTITFELPTEAQWEFAARGGNQSQHHRYSGGDDADVVAWHKDNAGNILHNAGEKQPNELGLYDMSGSLWEWCLDYYSTYPDGPSTNPFQNWGDGYVLRGGAWTYLPDYCRITCRDHSSSYSNDRSISNGFRIVINK